jgi:hypothetical protein
MDFKSGPKMFSKWHISWKQNQRLYVMLLSRLKNREDLTKNNFLFSRHCIISDRICGLEVRRSGFNSRRCQIVWEVVGLERGPPSLVSTTEELTEWYV